MADAGIAYPGPQGSAGELAAARYFGPEPPRLPFASLDAIHAAVAEGACRYGVMPLECSRDGPVNRSLDLLYSGAVSMVGEVLVPGTPTPPTPLGGTSCIRYGVIAGKGHPPGEDDDRLMIAVSLAQRTGSMLELLSPLARRRLSVEHWCSRPARVAGWHYRFHFTIAAPPDREDVRLALQDAAALACELRVLGRYRSAVRA